MNKIEQFIEQRLEKTLKDQYNKKFNIDQFDIRNYREYFMEALVLVIVKIRDGKIFYKSFSNYDEPDERIAHNLTYLHESLIYAKKKGLTVKDSNLYYWISDSFPWSHVENLIPICIYAKPYDKQYIVIPDNTFFHFNYSLKYRGSYQNWGQTVEIFKNIHENKPIETYSDFIDNLNEIKVKKSIAYFKGTATTKKESRIREHLEFISKNSKLPDNQFFKEYYNKIVPELNKNFIKSDIPIVIDLSAWSTYETLFNWVSYKYLLNLPGHYPWSNRLKYLCLTKSLIINIDSKKIGTDYIDNEYISFINYIIDPDVDYINIKHDHYNFIKKNVVLPNLALKQYNENNRVYNKIVEILNSTNENQYKKMTESAYAKATSLSMEHLYKYMINIINYNHDLFANNLDDIKFVGDFEYKSFPSN
jgi:hypothetical protein